MSSYCHVRALCCVSLIPPPKTPQVVPYAALLPMLDGVADVRQLEDLIIEATYRGLLGGKLDQNQQAVRTACRRYMC